MAPTTAVQPKQAASAAGVTTLSAITSLLEAYDKQNASKIKLIDAYLAFCIVTGIFQFLNMIIVGTYPINSFLAAFSCSIGCFVLGGGRKRQLILNFWCLCLCFFLCRSELEDSARETLCSRGQLWNGHLERTRICRSRLLQFAAISPRRVLYGLANFWIPAIAFLAHNTIKLIIEMLLLAWWTFWPCAPPLICRAIELRLRCSSKNRTFKPKKNIPEGSKQYHLKKYAEATLGAGNLRLAVQLPPDEGTMLTRRIRIDWHLSHCTIIDVNEWLAVNSNVLSRGSYDCASI